MDRAMVSTWWNDVWREGLWAASWEKTLSGITPAQAAWTPAPQRHSIWQNVAHMIFWRDDAVRRATGRPRASDEEVARMNFPAPTEISAAAWDATLARFRQSQEQIAALLSDGKTPIDTLAFLIPHDCYHMGQIALLRGLQNLPPLE